jgi:hypothetical protein
MATGRPKTPEERYDLVVESNELAETATNGEQGTFEASATSPDYIAASLGARADVDQITPAGRSRAFKRSILRGSMVFLRDQAAFNRLTVVALEDVTARLESIEARVSAIEAHLAKRPLAPPTTSTPPPGGSSPRG